MFKDLKKYAMFSLVSARSQLKSEVANSYLNWLWWVLEPFCFMQIYAFIYGVVFQAKEPNFSVFIFIGITIWDFFSRTTNVSVKLLRNNRGIISKVYIPKHILLLTKVWVNGFKMLISFGIVAVMMVIYRIPVTFNVLLMVPIIITLMVFSFGVGTILMHFGVFIDDLSNVVTILLRMLFYLTGIFYDVAKRIPAPAGPTLARANPIAFLAQSARDALIYGRTPDMKLMAVWFLVGVVLSIIGMQTIYRNENSYVKVL